MASEDVSHTAREAGQISIPDKAMFRFQDPSHHTGFTTRLVTMRQEKLLTDISLKAGSVTIPCHKVALAAASQYFYRRINLEQAPPVIELSGVHPKVLEVIIDFLYTAEMEIPANLVKELSVSCDQLELEALKQACDDYIEAKVQPVNALGLYTFSSKNHLEKTRKSAELCMRKKAEDIQRLSLDVEYANFSQDDLIKWIKDDLLQVSSEDTVYKIVERWVEVDPARDNDEVLETILSHVRMPLCTSKFLTKYVQDSPLHKHKSCQKYLHEAMRLMIQTLTGEEIDHQSERTRHRIGGVRTQPRIDGGPKHVLIGGVSNGVANNQCWYKEADDEVWKELTTLPPGQVEYPYHFRACVVDDGFVITGGRTQALKGTCSREAWHYSMASRTWQNLPPMNQARCEHGMVAVGQQVYIMGGYESSALTSVERLDVSSRQWTNMASLIHAACFCYAFLICGDIYLVTSDQKKTQKYSVVDNAWQVLTDPPQRSNCASMVNLGECIYVVGGKKNKQNMCYNTSTNTWTMLLAPAQTRFYGATLEHCGKVVLCGGAEGCELKKCESSVEEYDPESKQWTVSKLVLPKPLAEHFIIRI